MLYGELMTVVRCVFVTAETVTGNVLHAARNPHGICRPDRAVHPVLINTVADRMSRSPALILATKSAREAAANHADTADVLRP